MATGNQEQEREIISNLAGPISCLQINSKVLAVSTGTFLYIYDLEVIALNRNSPIFSICLKAQESIELVSSNIKYFDFIQEYILAMTEEG